MYTDTHALFLRHILDFSRNSDPNLRKQGVRFPVLLCLGQRTFARPGVLAQLSQFEFGYAEWRDPLVA
eukprot:2885531-Heterocapsa_arctica.AAC.1